MSFEGWRPTPEHHQYKRPETFISGSTGVEAQLFIQAREKFWQRVSDFDQLLYHLPRSSRKAELGSAMAKAYLDMARFFGPHDQQRYHATRQQLIRTFGEQEAEHYLSGWSAELAFAASAEDIVGLECYPSSESEDTLLGVDLWLDPSGAGLIDYVTEGTQDLSEDRQEYLMIGLSVKSSRYAPIADFPRIIPCHSLKDVDAWLAKNRDAYYNFFSSSDNAIILPHKDIDNGWLNFIEVAQQAASRLHGFIPSADGRALVPKMQPLNQRYDNVMPTVGILPAMYRPGNYIDGLPNDRLKEEIVQGILNPYQLDSAGDDLN